MVSRGGERGLRRLNKFFCRAEFEEKIKINVIFHNSSLFRLEICCNYCAEKFGLVSWVRLKGLKERE